MITTYDSNCFKCLSGSLHPFHDSGVPAETMNVDPRFSQLPPEEPDGPLMVLTKNRRRRRKSARKVR